jgi:hypothetical protein
VEIALALALLALAVTTSLFLAYRRRLHRQLGRDVGDPIPTVELPEVDAAFQPDDLGPTLAAEVRFIGSSGRVPGGTSDVEAWVLATLARSAREMFEFGTATGRTTYLWAVNSPADAQVHTLTLPPDARTTYTGAAGDSRRAATRAVDESAYTRFRYTGTPAEAKIEQLYGDSKDFDPSPYEGRCDLVFVDGSHAYSYVESDSANALRMLAPGGICLWHDYRGRHGTTRDVYRFLNRLARSLPLVRLRGTSLVAYRKPPAP